MGDLYIPISQRQAGEIEEAPKKDYSSDDLFKNPVTKKGHTVDVSFSPERLDNLVVSRGIPTLWQQSFICPCIDPVTGQADPLCPICHGSFRGYLPAIKDTIVAIQNQDRGTTHTKELGNLDLGTAQGTFRANAKINVLDRITIPDLTTRQNFVFDVTDERYESGFYIPYDIKNILYIVGYKDNKLVNLVEHDDYEYNSSEHKIYIKSDYFKGCNISMILEVTVRYIITNVLRANRYQYNQTLKKTVDLPKLALLKKESILINNMPLALKSAKDMEDDSRNQALSKEGMKLISEESSNNNIDLGDS